MAIQAFEEKVEKLCEERKVPGVVFVGGDAEGKYKYEKAFGRRSLKDLSKPDPLALDTPMWLASCTKIATTVAIMQQVEQGKIGIDDDVSGILHELKGVQILNGFEEGTDKPILVDNPTPITLRMMLTHSAGLSYAFFNPPLAKYRKEVDGYDAKLWISNEDTFERTYKAPLSYEPGTKWEYGCGVDWAGLMVERLTNQTLEEYSKQNIWAPLGVTGITYNIAKDPIALKKLADMSLRSGGFTPTGGALNPEAILEYTPDPAFNKETSFNTGGAGLYSPPRDLQTLLHSLCASDGKLLKEATIDLMFQHDHLGEAARQVLQATFEDPTMSAMFGGFDPSVGVTHGLGGMIFLGDTPGGRRAGTMNWGGYPNLLWFVDRTGGMSGMMGSQVLPSGDGLMNGLNGMWEREMYSEAGKV